LPYANRQNLKMISECYLKTQKQKAHEKQKIFTDLIKKKQSVIFLGR